jgi:hypothetical protein
MHSANVTECGGTHAGIWGHKLFRAAGTPHKHRSKMDLRESRFVFTWRKTEIRV